VLVFTTPALARALRIEGAAVARLFVQCDAVDTDLAVRLAEVYRDGRSMLLVDGIRRASAQRDAKRELLAAGTTVAVDVELPPVAVTIPAGHGLRVYVSSSNYDRFDVNLQDGSALSTDAGARAVRANVRVWTSARDVSRLDLPAVEEGPTGAGEWGNY
jgi:putative CocE/NonD family hydrolase